MSAIVHILMRRDTSTNWRTNNPLLYQGESGLETDTGNVKMGDGLSRWNALPYMASYINTTETPDINLSSTDSYIRVYINKKWLYAKLYEIV